MLTLAVAPVPPAAAAPLPSHPRELRFTPRPFAVPDAAAYRHVLGNGVVVYVVEDHALPLVQVALALRAGDFLDAQGAPGVAGLTAAMLLRGGTEALAPDAFDERADALAARLSSAAGSARAGAGLDCPSWVLEEALDLFFAMLRTPRFDGDRLAAAKGNLLASYAARNDDPGALLDRELGFLLHGPDHYLARQLSADDLARIDRAQLVAFHRRWWQPRGMVLAVSGDVRTEPLLADLERRFAGWAPGEAAPWPPPAPARRAAPGVYHVEKATPQAKVAIAVPTFARRGWDDPDGFAALVMGELLGGQGPSSRLLGRLRAAEGLVYAAAADVEVGDTFPGEARIVLATSNASAARAVALALAEVERLREEQPGTAELSALKRSLVDSFPYRFDSAEEVAGRFAEDDLLGRPHDGWRTWRERVAAVTPEQVRRMAERLLRPEATVILVVGPWRDIAAGAASARGGGRGGPLAGAVQHLPPRDPLTLQPPP